MNLPDNVDRSVQLLAQLPLELFRTCYCLIRILAAFGTKLRAISSTANKAIQEDSLRKHQVGASFHQSHTQ